MAARKPTARDGAFPSAHVPGQYIVRFKPAAVEHVARQPVGRSRASRAPMAAMPEEVAGPLDALRSEAGLVSVRPLFVTAAPPQPTGRMPMAAVRGALARSATRTPRESLRGFQLVEVKQKKLAPGLLKKLRASRAVELVEPVPNRWLSDAADPLINRQWGLRAIHWFDGKRPDAAKVDVAVLDTGVDEGHEDLESAVEAYRHDGNKARDVVGHGTHVSGIIAAVVNNAVGIAGVANCRLHCWKIFDDPEPGSDEEEFNFEFYSQALASALDTDIKVINLSIGGTERSQTEATIFRQLRDDGVIVAAAMGNEFEEGNPKEYPAGYDGPLAVGAVDEVGRRASFSNTGAHIGIVAPGVNILSTVPRMKAILADRTDYDAWDGTSMATPYVAGVAAVLYARREKSKAAAAAIMKRLQSTAQKLPAMRKKRFTREYGFGLVDLRAALRSS